MNKEEIYDNEIYPLMSKIIEVCQREKIAMLASFSIPTDENPHMKCTTALVSEKYGDQPQLKKAVEVIVANPETFLLVSQIN